jgi:ribonucleotide reductase beta subunit family protein with ferritin-like domain
MSEKEFFFKEWLKYKKAEDIAKNKRIEVEKSLVQIYGTEFDGNSKTFNEEDINFNINIKKNIKYNLDQEKYKLIRTDIPEELRPEKIKFELDLKGFEYLKENEKELYKKVSDCVEKKDNKPTINVEKK